jgi:4-hydroxythreonine-4-phosphate dehydrogenase
VTDAVARIAVTAGEPAGIGPELLVRLAQQAHPARLIAIADPAVLKQAADALGLPLELTDLAAGADASPHRVGPCSCDPCRCSSRCASGSSMSRMRRPSWPC